MNISKNTPQLAMQTPRSKYVVPPPVAISEPTPNLEPFITAQTPPAAPPSRNWRLYKPGAMPRGRLVDVQDVSALTSGEWSGERVYLGGQFVVSASDGSRATLRPQKPTATRTRIIAEFPQGFTAPAEGATFERGDLRPFQITDVRTSSDGQVNIYVREITSIAPAAASADASTFAKNNAAQSQASFDFPRYRENETRNSFSPATNQFGAARTYPGAHFLVMASDQNRVVLRPEDASGQPIASTRIIVELPPGVTPPREGSTLARSDLRGYRVYVVNRGNDGQLNVYMRDTARAM